MSSLSPPRTRSRSAGRPPRGEDTDSTRPPLLSAPRTSSKSTRPSRDKPDTIRTNSSSTSSTSGSSFLDRIRAPSSRTSLEDTQADPPSQRRAWASSRAKTAVQAEEEQYDEDDPTQRTTTSFAGHGADLWSRVTAVASNLTVNVGQAWQNSVLADGEETPPGRDSRLTRAMKAYHLDRARSPADLPAWLFNEHERGAAPNSWSASNPRQYEDRFRPDREPEPRQRGGLRDVYDRAAASSSSAPDARRQPPESGGGGSRAANRLKAIRDAKRSMKMASEPAQSHSEDPRRDVTASSGAEPYPNEPQQESGTRRSTTRVGLPAGPGRMRRQ